MKANLLITFLFSLLLVFGCQPNSQEGSDADGEKTGENAKQEQGTHPNAELVRAWSGKHVKGNDDDTNYMSNDFILKGPGPQPMNKAAYRAIMKSMREAFPDLDNNLKITAANDNMVEGIFRMEGTHKGTFNLDAMGMGVHEATNKSFKLPEESFKIGIKDGKIASMDVEVPEGGGLAGVFEQLGLEMPK